jgi:hypothetical protein
MLGTGRTPHVTNCRVNSPGGILGLSTLGRSSGSTGDTIIGALTLDLDSRRGRRWLAHYSGGLSLALTLSPPVPPQTRPLTLIAH